MQVDRVKLPAEWEDVVKRALASELFRKSPKLRDLLAYAAGHSLKAERELLSEQHIDVAVFREKCWLQSRRRQYCPCTGAESEGEAQRVLRKAFVMFLSQCGALTFSRAESC